MARLRWQVKTIKLSRSKYKSSRKQEQSNAELSNSDRKRRLSLPRYVLLVVMFLLLFSALTAMLIERRVSPSIHSWALARVESLATRAINLAIEETLALNISTSAFSNIISDNQGNLQAIQYDTGEINRVSSAATHKVLQALNNLGAEEFPVPLGQISGLDFLSGWGPNIPVRVIPTGSVMTTPISSFESAGINQTIHRIYLDVDVTMRVVIPFNATTIPVSTSFPIVEEIIVGAVPTWYFGPSGMVGGFQDNISGQNSIEFDINNLGL